MKLLRTGSLPLAQGLNGQHDRVHLKHRRPLPARPSEETFSKFPFFFSILISDEVSFSLQREAVSEFQITLAGTDLSLPNLGYT